MKEQNSNSGKVEIGLIGLAVMGANLARNLANKKIKTIVYNRTHEKTKAFVNAYSNEFLIGETDLCNFVEKIQRPRKIILLIKAGVAIDEILRQLIAILDRDDIIVDCGNSYYKHTERRFNELKVRGIHFVGCGISGGEEGALNGPSLMPGGTKEAWQNLKPILEKIAAKDFNNKPCVTYIGDGSAGHYVKMVHNGIEYGVMQLMAEAYDMLRKVYKLSPPEIAKIFAQLNKGKLKSYLFEIAAKVLNQKDEFKKGYLIDYIQDTAAQKGTGSWTALDALYSNVALPTITEAVFARLISADLDKRKNLNKIYKAPKISRGTSLTKFTKLLEDALYAAILSTYAQGYALIQSASKKYKWDINLAELSRIWEGGCIIRAQILNSLHKAYGTNNQKHLFEINDIAKNLKKTVPALRETVAIGAKNGIAISGLASALSYFEATTNFPGSANFIQGLRDFFGAHTYKRNDREGDFHTEWQNQTQTGTKKSSHQK